MKARSVVAGLALTVGLSPVWAADSFDPDKLPQVPCSAIKFSKAFLQKYPKAPDACIEARQYKGQKYAKFNARVFLPMTDRITVEILNPNGDSVDTFSFKPSPSAMVSVNGKDTSYKDLRKGDPISFWVPQSRMEVHATPTSTSEAWTVLPPTK
jgi:hypothetical protein